MKAFFKCNFSPTWIFMLFFLFPGTKAEAQGIGCNELNFTITLQLGTTCCYKLTANNTAVDNCFRAVNLNLGSNVFQNFEGLSGWQVNMIGDGEYNIRPAIGFIPTGITDVASFCVYGDPASELVIQWNNLCLNEGCDQIIPLSACSWEGIIQGIVYADIGCVGNEYNDQPTLEGWAVNLYDENDQLVQESITNDDGFYLFYNLPKGNYYIRVNTQTNWNASVPNNGEVQVNLGINETITENFGFCRNDCNCDSLLYSVLQVEENKDTLTYYISLTASQDICYRFLEVEVNSGQLVDFNTISSLACCNENDRTCCHWTGIQTPGTQKIILEHDSGSIPIYNDIILKLRLTGGDVHKISIKPLIDEFDNSGLCYKSFAYMLPIEPLLNCCPNKTFLGSELICNGDFNVVNPTSTGYCFTSDYGYFTGAAIGSDSYTVGNAATVSVANGGYWGCVGKTGPTDNFMIIDGGSPSNNIWQEKIPVKPSEEYTFSIFMNCIDKIYTQSPKIDVFINSLPFNSLTAPINAGWQNLTFCWNSGTDTIADITIRTNHNFGYNDFALDCISFKQCIKEDTCVCGNFNLWYSIGRGPLLNYKCGDTLLVPSSWSLLPIRFLPELICQGTKCDTPTVDWVLTGPAGSGFIPISQNAVQAIPGFSVPINNSTFIHPGVYELTLIGHCGPNQCPCKLYFTADGYVCCQDYIDFSLAVTNSIQVSVDSDTCKATINIQNLEPCAYIERIDWGDGITDYGTFTAGSMIMHTYAGNGTFIINYLVIEKDPATGLICFEKLVSDTVVVKCKYVCCEDYEVFVQAVDAATTVTIDPSNCKVILNVGNLPCNDYLEWVNWGDGNLNYGPYTSGSMIMHTYPGSGTYIITYLAIEKTPGTNLICFEKILRDTITLQCSYTCCKDYNAFVQAVDAATTITIDPSNCKVILNVGNLPCNDYLEWLNWGDGNQNYGPFVSNSMTMHTYSASGTYIITYLAIEKDPITGLICFEKILSDTITLQCSYNCCKDYNAFVQAVDAATTITIDSNACKVTLNIGDLPCNDYLEWVNWGDGNQNYGPFTSGSMIMHTYSASGTYVIKYLGIEKDPATGFICFEKILKDTIKLQCSYTCCKNYSAFVQAVDAATTITIDSNACKVTLNIGNLPCSDYLEWVDWGDGNQIYGPFTSGSMIMHTYSAIGTFIVTYLAIEKNPVTGLICFEKILKDTISLQCKNVGTYLTLDNDKNVFIYPNPASDDFNIIWSEELSSIDNVIIVDIMGKKLKNQAIVRNTNIAKLSVSSISEGFYMVQVYSSGKLIAVKKLIKN